MESKNLLVNRVFGLLQPLVGSIIAENAIETQMRKIGISDIEDLTHKDLPPLAEELRKGLVIFIGSSNARLVASKIAELN